MAQREGTISEARSAAAGALTGDRNLDLDLFRRMTLIRKFEDGVQALFLQGEVHGTTHLYSGQEAGAVGVCSMLADGDRVAATYRGHGAALALGMEPQELMDELCGRATGICGGRAGSMNVVDLARGLIGCFGIVGGSIAAATGAALAFQQRELDNVAVAFFGDGASNQGYFHECLNMAQVMKLPVVFVCENNHYMEFTPIEEVTAGEITARPAAMGIPASRIDGNDVWTVREAAGEALEHARRGDGPVFLELVTYRLVGHSRSDPGKYRKPGELDEWKLREPLVVARRRLSEDGVDEDTLTAIETEVTEQIEQVKERALQAPWPSPDEPATEFKA